MMNTRLNWIEMKEEKVMTIGKSANDGKITRKIEGRLDTTTAPQLEEVVVAAAAEAKELVLDCETLAYVSSAGLRVILKAQKLMNRKGTLKLTHVNEPVMEVTEITGCGDILTIE